MRDHDIAHQEAIRRAVREINECWLEKRYDGIGGLVAEDAVIAPPGSDIRVRGREAYVQSYRDYDQAATTIEFSPGEPAIDVVGNAAVAVCPFLVVYELQGKTYRESGRDILVFTLSGGKWLVSWRTMLTDSPEK